MADVEHINPYRGDDRAKDEQVESMFDAIAPAYDFMNHAMTMGLDRLWLRRLVRAAAEGKPADIVDLATGTGDVAFALARKMPGARITGLDLSEGMLDKARTKAAGMKGTEGISFRRADCLATGLPDCCADAITVAYGVRNFADIAAGYREMYRILRPGGKLCVLELSAPTAPLTKALYRLYTSTLIPAAGRLLSHDDRAYSYLPESIAAAPQRGAMTALMTEAGFDHAKYRSFTFGACTLYTAFKL
ncbi:MAG: bifunctional demethylmenaquinone methyltransferase/2-methoxy-6-polyprenyl-1,4-benzoquinol methylase UbiE [Muribaculaceae bacterium]|nr:bifunctional demethylmenaquinone methyltransferase/2-methoxy-6-polyprenyl-1,4-benzoquinol methylase UbiE [Muribaculaceae bacterium]